MSQDVSTTLRSDLESDYKALEEAHDLFLRKFGVVLPQLNTQQALALIFLYRNKGALVSLESIRAFVRRYLPNGSHDIQPRHLQYQGWYLLLSGKSNDILPSDCPYLSKKGVPQVKKKGEKLPNGYNLFVTETSPYPDFKMNKRRGFIDRSSWEALVKAFDGRCAVCREALKLERGHKDPHKGYALDNILPMCSECNNWASNDVVLDDRGRVTALASPKLVRNSELSVRLQIFDELLKDRDVAKGR